MKNPLDLSCQRASLLLSRGQDAPLGLYARLKLRLHLTLCDGCTNFAKQLKFMRAAVRRLRDGEDR